MVSLEEKLTANCNYAYNPSEAILSIGWQFGEMQGSLSPIASYVPVLDELKRYPNIDYQPPAYIMTVESLRPGQGRSTFTIQAVNWTDAKVFWCTISLNSGAFDVDSVSITISGRQN